jgi:glutamate/tyrosine decarboxylase-like PLP-dependent enzyme
MSGEDHPFLRWALRYVLDRVPEDGDSPAFRAEHETATSLTDAERELVRGYPAEAADAAELQEQLAALMDRHLVNGRSPRFQNQLFSGVEEEALAGSFLGIFPNNTISTREVAPLPSEMETAVTSWLLHQLPWDMATADGTLTPAGSFSNYLAVYLARRRATDRQGRHVLPRLAAFTSQAAHYSIPKGADLCGVPRDQVFEIPTDTDDRMIPERLAEAIAAAEDQGLLPFFVNATLGTTVAGSLDPVAEIRGVLGNRDVWLHADGAWGALGLLGSEADRFRAAVSHADSLTWDAHKGLGAPVSLSYLMVRDATALDVLRPSHGGGYLFRDLDAPREEADLGLRSLYCGKPFLALSLWLLWKAKGIAGLRAHVDHARAMTLRFRDLIAASERYDLAHEPETWVVCFRPRGDGDADALAEETRARVNASGRWMINLCPSSGGRVFRALFVNPLMTEAHVDELAQHLDACHPATG